LRLNVNRISLKEPEILQIMEYFSRNLRPISFCVVFRFLYLYTFMLSFHEMLGLMEQEPPMMGGVGGAPPMPPGGGMGPPGGAPPMPPGGGMGIPGGAPGPMGGAPPMPGAPMGGGVEPTEMKPSDVWHVLNRILEGKPIDEKKPGGQQGQDKVGLGQQPVPPEQPPPTAGPPSMGPPQSPMPAAVPPQQMMGLPM
jgi:hypothetical protein